MTLAGPHGRERTNAARKARLSPATPLLVGPLVVSRLPTVARAVPPQVRTGPTVETVRRILLMGFDACAVAVLLVGRTNALVPPTKPAVGHLTPSAVDEAPSGAARRATEDDVAAVQALQVVVVAAEAT